MHGDDHESWVVAQDEACCAAARRRALLLESMMPYRLPDPSSVSTVTCVQSCARGMLGRRRAAERRSVADLLCEWKERCRAQRAIERHILQEHCATVIQNAYRRFDRRWTRPKVRELLVRIRTLERKLHEAKKRKRR